MPRLVASILLLAAAGALALGLPPGGLAPPPPPPAAAQTITDYDADYGGLMTSTTWTNSTPSAGT